MPLEPGSSDLVVVALAALLGGVLGRWPLAAWARRNMLRAGAAESGVRTVPGVGTVPGVRTVPRGGTVPGVGTEFEAPTVAGVAVEPGVAARSGMTAVPGAGVGPGNGPGFGAEAASTPIGRNSPASALPHRSVNRACGALTALGWGFVVWRVGLDPALASLLAFVAAGSVLAIVDTVEHRLPNRVLAPASAAVAVLLALAAAVSGDWPALLGAGIGGAAMFGCYLLVALVSPAAMGMGDVKLAGLIGLVLGWFGLDAWLIGLAGAFVIGGVVAVVALALRRVALRGSLPFGPSMLAGALVAVLVVG